MHAYRMEKYDSLKCRRRRCLQAPSFVCTPTKSSSNSVAAYLTRATTRVASPDVTTDKNVTDSNAYKRRRSGCCSILFTLVLTSSLHPFLHDFVLYGTNAVASTHHYSSTKAETSAGSHNFGIIWAEAIPRVLPAQMSGSEPATAASSAPGKGPYRPAGKVVQGNPGGSSLPMLVRRPYMTDHPEMVRFPLSVDADLTDESFEAVEKASLEIARAVRQQQQQHRRRRENEAYANEARMVPAAAKKSHLTKAGADDEHEGVGVATVGNVANSGAAAGSARASQYKFAESVATGNLAADGHWKKSMLNGDFEEDGETGFVRYEIESAAPQSEGGGTGGRLIVGLTEITFPKTMKKTQSVADPERDKAAGGLPQPPLNASPLREQAKHSNGSSGEEAALGARRWSADASEDGGESAEESGEDGGAFLSHKEALREANQRLRLDQLQDLRIIKGVKVLENVGLVILEFQDDLSEEEIKETVKTLWQRNRSTWLIEPDSEINFRGRDSFESGEFVPVVPTKEEEEAAEQQKQEKRPENVQETHAFLTGQELHPGLHRQQQRVQHEKGPQRNIRTHKIVKSQRAFAPSTTEKSVLETTPSTAVDSDVDAAHTRVSRTEQRKQRRGGTASRKKGKRLASSSTFGLNRGNVSLETADPVEPQLQELEERKTPRTTESPAVVPHTAAERRLTVISSAPTVPSVLKGSNSGALVTDAEKPQANPESGGRLNEAQHQTQQEPVIPDRTRNISHTTGAGVPTTGFSAPAATNDFIAIEETSEEAMSSTSHNRTPISLLKPHMGILPLSLYDAAQEALQEALGGDKVFRSLETSTRDTGCDECFQALAACRRRHEFAQENAATGSPYNVSIYTSSSSAPRSYSTTSTSDNSHFKHTCTEAVTPRSVTQTSHGHTRSGTQWVNWQKRTDRAQPQAREQVASRLKPREAARPIRVTAEDGLLAGETSDAAETLEYDPSVDQTDAAEALEYDTSEGQTDAAEALENDPSEGQTDAAEALENDPSEGQTDAAEALEYDPSEDQTDSFTHRRLTFAPHMASVSEKHLPNDQYFSRQWAYHGPRVNVHAVEAWNLVYKHRLTSQRRREGVSGRAKPVKHTLSSSTAEEGKAEPIIVAVIDTGIDYTHEDLRTQMWVNKGEIPDNGIDDDGNGYVDDYRGYDFENDRSDPMDHNGHGTHVAGIIAAAANNRRGITGVNWEARLMPLKFIARSAAAAEAIDYSLRMGAKISTNSWGYASPSEGLKMAIRRTAAKGQLFVSAVDNAGKDNTYTPDYPPNWGFDKRTNKGARNILRVANLTAEGGVAGTSNFGPNNVDVVAPGTDIISTVPARKFPEGYGYKTGTSMATPLVAGIAAMVWAANRALTAEDVRDCIVRTSTRLRPLEGFVIAGNVNAYAAVLDVLGPPKELPANSKEGRSAGRVSSATQSAGASSTPAAPAAAAADTILYSAQPVTTALAKGNVFPSEEAFFQHISQTQPYYAPPAVVAEHTDDSKSSATAEAEKEPHTSNESVTPSSVPYFVASLASLLGPLNKLGLLK